MNFIYFVVSLQMEMPVLVHCSGFNNNRGLYGKIFMGTLGDPFLPPKIL